MLPMLDTLCRVLTIVLGICYFYQILYLLVPLLKKKKHFPQAKPRHYAILIAARNEEKVLPYLLESIASQDYPSAYLTTYVVADNCTDRTSQAALAHGARVYERFNQKCVGKGYALNFLLSKIERDVGLDSYDGFLIFDADNLLQPDYIRQINAVAGAGYQAFCGYRNTKNFGTNWLSAGYGVWYLHDSAHLNQSRMMLGTGCAVSGTGFGFTRELLRQMGGWNFFTLTEDLEFDAWSAAHGVKIGYCHDAVLYDEQPSEFAQSWKQRTRWSQGGIQIAGKYSGQLLHGLLQGGWASYTAFETLTLSMWGCLISGACGVLTMLNVLMNAGMAGVVAAAAAGILSGYLSMMLMGALTVATEWKRIPASTKMKLVSVFSFPIFMLTFIPIAVTAVFRKFQWSPTIHSVAVSSKSLIQHS